MPDFGVEGLSTINDIGELSGTVDGLPHSRCDFLGIRGGSWVAVTMYSGGAMVLGSLCILYPARFSFEKKHIWAFFA